ncbi:hypothetical protein L596_018809 [Steinernema carpocapsae]|uniref:Uncharacterized protein n=1 Tax=Steinernema carpocapsae TaxID=34508 RepID=A0A4U5N6A8_STECR|nr:hypothetical protein L596_018809 [Steinernema carpocapsae]
MMLKSGSWKNDTPMRLKVDWLRYSVNINAKIGRKAGIYVEHVTNEISIMRFRDDDFRNSTQGRSREIESPLWKKWKAKACDLSEKSTNLIAE